MKWGIVVFVLILFGCGPDCDKCPPPSDTVAFYANDHGSTNLDSVIYFRYNLGANFKNPIDSFLLIKAYYFRNIDNDSKNEKVLEVGISDKFEYLFCEKKDKWKVKVTNIKIKHHSEKGRCGCDYDFADSFLINDTLYVGSYEIK